MKILHYERTFYMLYEKSYVMRRFKKVMFDELVEHVLTKKRKKGL